MAISDLRVFNALRSKMDWHQSRQNMLAENVANADTPGYRATDLKQFRVEEVIGSSIKPMATQVTSSGHIVGKMKGGLSTFKVEEEMSETTPSGNNVVLEEQMMKVAANQMDYQTATTLYKRSIGLIKTAISRG
ncbi:MAG: flagellar basal body rod protein FlgB [Rhodobacteraceae bacterium]|nr:flagellar basal body rod protein FlgB [Paracoccaceae bacterium]